MRTLPAHRRLPWVLGSALLLAAALGAAWYGQPQRIQPALVELNRQLAGLGAFQREAAGHRWHYLDGGAGEPVVLLHGIFAEKDHWVDLARPLTRHHRVVVPDLPGYGESSRLDGARYDYAAQVVRLKAFLDALGIQRAHLAGSSMGGTLAALFALAHPERVASLAFIGAPHGIRSPRPSEADRLIDAGRLPLIAHDAAEFEALMQRLFARPPWLPYPVLAEARRAAITRAVSNRRLWQEHLPDRQLLQARLPALALPTLVLWGAEDRVFDVSGLQVLRAQLPGADTEVLAGLGHLPMMEAPAAVADRYLGFLARLPPPGPGAPLSGSPAPSPTARAAP